MIDFSIVSDTSSIDFKEAMGIYLQAFPDNERQPADKIKSRVEHGYYSLIIAKRNKSVAGFSLLFPFIDLNFGLLDYMAVQKEQQGFGIGSKLFDKTFELLRQDIPTSFLLLEVEDPAFGDPLEKDTRFRRVKFYRKLGAKAVTNFRYLMPPLSGNSPTNMLLMVYMGSKLMALNPQSLLHIVTAIYSKVYERDEDDPYLGQMLENLPDNVVLI
jgi:GNAT superfamily N-acetyltransferase